MVADFTWLSYHPTDAWPRCQYAVVQTGIYQYRVSTGSAEGQFTEGYETGKTSENSILSPPSPFLFLSRNFRRCYGPLLKGFGLEGPSCQYLKMEVGGNVVADDQFSREHPGPVQRGPIKSC